jgi:hypothetical protein
MHLPHAPGAMITAAHVMLVLVLVCGVWQVRMAKEVQQAEERLAAAHARFADERTAASQVALQWAASTKAAEKKRADEEVRVATDEKERLAARLAEVESERCEWQAKCAAAEAATAGEAAKREAAEEGRRMAEGRAEECTRLLQLETQAVARGVERIAVEEARTAAAVVCIAEVEGEVEEARHEITRVLTARDEADARADAGEEAQGRAAAAEEAAEARAAEAEEEVKEMKKQRTRDVAKAAGWAKKEAAKEAAMEVAKETEKWELHAKRQVMGANKKAAEELAERLKQHEADAAEAMRVRAESQAQALRAEKEAAVAKAVRATRMAEALKVQEMREQLEGAEQEMARLQAELATSQAEIERRDAHPVASAEASSSMDAASASVRARRALAPAPENTTTLDFFAVALGCVLL